MYIEYDQDRMESLVKLPVKIIICQQLVIFIEEEFIDGILKYKYLGSLRCALDNSSLLIINQVYPTATHYVIPTIHFSKISSLKAELDKQMAQKGVLYFKPRNQ
jgi:hypothetical protein